MPTPIKPEVDHFDSQPTHDRAARPKVLLADPKQMMRRGSLLPAAKLVIRSFVSSRRLGARSHTLCLVSGFSRFVYISPPHVFYFFEPQLDSAALATMASACSSVIRPSSRNPFTTCATAETYCP